jgi:protein TonB
LRLTTFVLCLLGTGLAAPLFAQAGREPAPGTTRADKQPLYKVGGGVEPPKVLFAPSPQFSDEARRAKVGGSVLVYVEVGTDGLPSHVRIIRGVGMGLDEKAVEAVKQYRFRPATRNGEPVSVAMNVEVNFQIYNGPKDRPENGRKDRPEPPTVPPDQN